MTSRRWEDTKDKVLGKRFELSVVFADNVLMKKLNATYRKKARTTNVLSFSLSKKEGEIFINKTLARKEAKEIEMPTRKYLDFLFVHSLLHLKGYEHGKEMERKEQSVLSTMSKNIIKK